LNQIQVKVIVTTGRYTIEDIEVLFEERVIYLNKIIKNISTTK